MGRTKQNPIIKSFGKGNLQKGILEELADCKDCTFRKTGCHDFCRVHKENMVKEKEKRKALKQIRKESSYNIQHIY